MTTQAIKFSETNRDVILRTETISPGEFNLALLMYEADCSLFGDFASYFIPSKHEQFPDDHWHTMHESDFENKYDFDSVLINTQFVEITLK